MKIRSLLNLVLVTALLMLSGLIWPVLAAEHIQTQGSRDANRQEAERLWELAIAAKGVASACTPLVLYKSQFAKRYGTD